MKILNYLSLCLLLLTIWSCKHETLTANYNVIPMPNEVTLQEGNPDFKLTGKTEITYPVGNETLRQEAEHLQNYIFQLTGHNLKISEGTKTEGAINLSVENSELNPEGYCLTITPETITIEGSTNAGVFYGIQTLRKSIPANQGGKYNVDFPAATIKDFPRFAYRGAHFDVARHFFPADSVKKFIDLLALHNINTLHWHITDDQGWRVEIKKHPKLTEIGSKRSGTVIGHNTPDYDTIPVEGYYTQDQIKDIIQYASDRHITIIPEIDLPGHMQAALSAYPELGCTGGPYDVWQKWGVSEEVLCAGNDSVYTFIEDVLGEVSDLFPSEYVHIGGDECPKIRWEECVKCQARIKELGLKTDSESSKEDKLQSHVMKRAEDFLASKGKKVIGWDEILEGGASENATIMSWRGEAGGIAAARNGNDVIMTPNTYLYFDYYQTLDRENEPEAIGGYVPLSKVYSYEPIPESFSPEEASHIKGVQANLWTEYIKTFPQVIYMELPRMAALSEVQWTQGDKDYEKFMNRLPAMMAHYEANGYPYSMRAYDINGDIVVDTENNTLSFNLVIPQEAPIYFTTDGSEPTTASQQYTGPVSVDKDTKLRAMAVYPFGNSKVFTDSVKFNKATAKPVTLLTTPARRYTRNPEMLTDGQTGSNEWNSDKWIGYNSTDAIIVLDLQQPQTVSNVSTNLNVDTGSHIFDVRKMNVSVSNDGENWKEVASADYPALEKGMRGVNNRSLDFQPVETRYLKIALEPEKSIPAWHPAKGNGAFIFIDEINVN